MEEVTVGLRVTCKVTKYCCKFKNAPRVPDIEKRFRDSKSGDQNNTPRGKTAISENMG